MKNLLILIMTPLLSGAIILGTTGCGSKNETPAQSVSPAFQGLTSVAMENGTYHLSWAAATDDNTKGPFITYRVFESENPSIEAYDFGDPTASTVGTTSIDITGLDISKRHYFIVRVCDKDGNCDMNTTQQTDRVLHLSGAPNFRDLGGYINADGQQVRWDRIYRSGQLSKLTDKDMAIVNGLGLNRIMDLRQEREIKREPDKLYADNETKYDFLKFSLGDPYLVNTQVPIELAWDVRQVDFPSLYVNMLEQNKEGIREAFERFADPSQYPILFHCTQGKDRAGVVSALLLLSLKVPDKTVMQDYMLTCQLVDIQKKIDDMKSYLESFANVVLKGVTAQDWAPMLSCLPDAMQNLLDYIEAEYNGVDGFLESIGISSSQQQTIRETLLAN